MALSNNRQIVGQAEPTLEELLRKSIFSDKEKQSPSYINGVIRDMLATRQAQLCARMHEHEDWVHPQFRVAYLEKTEFGTSEHYVHLLNSWALKSSITKVPSTEELRKIAEWHRVIIFRETRKRTVKPTHLDVLSFYVDNAFKQLEAHTVMLTMWKKARFPTIQEDCGELDYKVIRISIGYQEQNLVLASKTLQKAIAYLAPELVRAYYERAVIEASKVLHHLKKLEKLARK